MRIFSRAVHFGWEIGCHFEPILNFINKFSPWFCSPSPHLLLLSANHRMGDHCNNWRDSEQHQDKYSFNPNLPSFFTISALWVCSYPLNIILIKTSLPLPFYSPPPPVLLQLSTLLSPTPHPHSHRFLHIPSFSSSYSSSLFISFPALWVDPYPP